MPVNKHTQQSLIGSCGNVEYRNYTILMNHNTSQHQTRAIYIYFSHVVDFSGKINKCVQCKIWSLNIIGYFIVRILWLS